VAPNLVENSGCPTTPESIMSLGVLVGIGEEPIRMPKLAGT
jgi:hypothetical protein